MLFRADIYHQGRNGDIDGDGAITREQVPLSVCHWPYSLQIEHTALNRCTQAQNHFPFCIIQANRDLKDVPFLYRKTIFKIEQ